MNFTDLRVIKTQERLQNALLELLKTKELKEITVREICMLANISRNAFYQHYGYKEDLYDQMVAQATEQIRSALNPIVRSEADVSREAIEQYAKQIIEGIMEVKELLVIMLKRDHGEFLRQLTDLIFSQMLENALQFYDMKDSEKVRLYYGYISAGIAAFIIQWALSRGISPKQAASLLADILLHSPAYRPDMLFR